MNLKRKILAIFFSGLFLLTSIISVTAYSKEVTNTVTKEENKDELSYTPLLADAEIMISHSTVLALATIYLSGFQPAGDYRCEYSVDFYPADSFERLVGEWHVEIFAGDITFFKDVGNFDYTGNNEPDDISKESIRYIPKGYRMITAHCWVSYDIYIGGEYHHHMYDEGFMQWEIFFPREHSISNNKFTNNLYLRFIENHPNLFPIFLQLLEPL